MPLADQDIDQVLAAIEERELRSLQWGYVDGSFSREELEDLIGEVIPELRDPGAADKMLSTLLDLHLMYSFFDVDSSEHRYRSRFAETARLLRTLKQLMPKRNWQTAPNLVSDFRVDARPRQAPRRDIPPAQVLEHLQLQGDWQQIATLLLDGILLSAFQLRAVTEILRQTDRSRGVVVSAGTGSGKTFAFYFPALLEIANWVSPNDYWTKALSIYPRVELVKDQFNVAFELARRLDARMKVFGRRPIVLGTLFGLTPRNASAEALEAAKWVKVSGGDFICPFLRCPQCQHEMRWKRRDVEAGTERLVCANSACKHMVTQREIVLTRKQARLTPPDIMFVTAEMVNRRLSDTTTNVVLGMQPNRNRRVKLLLLDEIHTYTDTTGAQTAMVIRRWRHALDAPVRCVGLSATLREAPDFFSQLTGLPRHTIVEVNPHAEELEHLSMEYQFILRGDPVSQTSLLSTSIQTAFLLGRILERPSDQDSDSQSGGRFGRRLFVFTDDLDIVNRFYDDLRDAEGYPSRERGLRPPLTELRAPDSPKYAPAEASRRDSLGQIWRLCQDLGHSLSDKLRISRTSSQDIGVSASSDIVVATSSLEIGYNDLGVGAVLQHKSPHEMASCVQRKGRAGRNLRMRPFMITVLSDYGRDRLTFQAYEQLFDPMLAPQILPVQNHYILRMHAVLAFIDWLASTHNAKKDHIWWWHVLNGPMKQQDREKWQKELRSIIGQLMTNEGGLRTQLEQHIERAMGISSDIVQALMWEPPRSLMLEVLPTLDRRLATEWNIGANGTEKDLMATPPSVHPLPDFIAANLFSDLCLPEVTITLPLSQSNADAREETMAVVQALNQFAPGRVTRRFGNEEHGVSHWVPVPLDQPNYSLSIAEFATQYEYVSEIKATHDDALVEMSCYRPWSIRVAHTPNEVAITSNAFLTWESIIQSHGDGFNFPILRAGKWKEIIKQWDFYLHSQRSPVTVTRFAHSAIATIQTVPHHEDSEVITHFMTPEGTPTAIGFAQEVDGIWVRFTLPPAHILRDRVEHSTELRVWRTAYFRDVVRNDDLLSSQVNSFQADWLYQIYLSALIVRACQDNCTLQQAHVALHASELQSALRHVMDSIFQINNDDDLPDEQKSGKLVHTLSGLLEQESILGRLKALAMELWAPNQERWEQWLRERLHETLGEILLQACMYCVPQQAGTETLLLDLGQLEKQQDGSAICEVWITESTLGGVGVVEAIARAIGEDPGCLSRALTATIAPDVLEVATGSLDRFVALLTSDQAIAAATAKVREQSDHRQRDAARIELYRLLAHRGLHVDHTFSVALNHRLLRRDLNAAGDTLMADIMAFWRATETRLHVAMDLRIFAYLASTDPALRPRIQNLITAIVGSAPTDEVLVGIISSLLWAREAEVRSHAFKSYSPFIKHDKRGWTDAALVRELLLPNQLATIHVGDDDWRAALITELAERGGVILIAAQSQEAELRQFLAEIIAMPISVDYLQFFPSIQRIERKEDDVVTTLVIQEIW
jgi:hypothetical protein